MKTLRVFPRRTAATPIDQDAVIGPPDLFSTADKVLISCAFTWDIPVAEQLYKEWTDVAPTELGGPAFGDPGGEFIPGKFLSRGHTITSRGCPNRCWFCYAWKRSGVLRELEIKDGWIIGDDNLLACSDDHILAVFDMLARQPEKARFTGGLDTKLLKEWQVERLWEIKPKMVFFAYDTPDDLEPLMVAGKTIKRIFKTVMRANFGVYTLIGYPGDTFQEAEKRLSVVRDLGFYPFAMLYRDDKNIQSHEWRTFQRSWIRPKIIYGKMMRTEET
jgi:hypothetical protein